jgi:uncharacterized protein YkwD
MIGAGFGCGVDSYLEPVKEKAASLKPVSLPTDTPASSRNLASPPSPTVAVLPPAVSAGGPTTTPTGADAVMATPTAPTLTEQEIVVSAFAECNARYSGDEIRGRADAASSAIDSGLHSVSSIRALVEENCDGVFPRSSAIAGSTASKETTNPTRTPRAEPTHAAPNAIEPSPTKILATTSTPQSGLAGNGRFDGPSLEKEIHQLINAERTKRGIPELIWDGQIAVIARDHSEDMASTDYFRHDNRKGESPTDRGNTAGYPCRKSLGGGVFSYGLGENIWSGWEYSSYTYGTGGNRYNWMSQTQLARQAVLSWMNSTGHRENILDSQYDRTAIGVGFGTAGGKKYAVYLTQNFC